VQSDLEPNQCAEPFHRKMMWSYFAMLGGEPPYVERQTWPSVADEQQHIQILKVASYRNEPRRLIPLLLAEGEKQICPYAVRFLTPCSRPYNWFIYHR
jgi:hypothetical protein